VSARSTSEPGNNGAPSNISYQINRDLYGDIKSEEFIGPVPSRLRQAGKINPVKPSFARTAGNVLVPPTIRAWLKTCGSAAKRQEVVVKSTGWKLVAYVSGRNGDGLYPGAVLR
jgi:hypothetical protein